jgi:tetrahydromethanopterin S-methyltransferase subunit B
MKDEIKNKASVVEITSINNQLTVLETLIERLTPRIPSEFIENSLDEIRSTLDSLVGRVGVLEEAVINKNFDK